jgi:hypothetical protein
MLNGEEVQISAPVEIAGDLGLQPGEAAMQDNGRIAFGCGRGSILVSPSQIVTGGGPLPTADRRPPTSAASADYRVARRSASYLARARRRQP